MANSAERILNDLKPSPAFAPHLYLVLTVLAANPPESLTLSVANPATSVLMYLESVAGNNLAVQEIKRQLSSLHARYTQQ